MSLSDDLTSGLISPPFQPQQPVPKAKPQKTEATTKLPQKKSKKSRHSRPGHADVDKQKPLPRGEPFEMPNTITKWSTR